MDPVSQEGKVQEDPGSCSPFYIFSVETREYWLEKVLEKVTKAQRSGMIASTLQLVLGEDKSPGFPRLVQGFHLPHGQHPIVALDLGLYLNKQ